MLQRALPATAVLVLVTGLLAAMPAQGQGRDAVGAVTVLEDPAGDGQAAAFAGPAQAWPGERWQALDLRGLHVEEHAATLRFGVEVASFTSGPEVALVESSDYWVRFAFGNATYLAEGYRNLHITSNVEGPNVGGSLWRASPAGDAVARVADLEATIEGDVLWLDVPRELVRDEHAATPFPGRVLDGLAAWSVQILLDGPPLYEIAPVFLGIFLDDQPLPPHLTSFRDRMPDSGNGTMPYDVRLGHGDAFHAGLYTNAPMRQSNGEATTFVYPMQVANLQDQAESFRLTARGVPAGWEVWFPVQDFDVAAGAIRDVPVPVRVPFAHDHGAEHRFTLRAEARAGDAFAEVEVGVLYPEIPQPAGHHDTVWLHGRPDPFVTITITSGDPVEQTLWGEAYMNTLPDVDGDFESLPETGSTGFQAWPHGFAVPLSPSLAMGVRMDVDRTGHVEVPVTARYTPQTGVHLEGALVVTGAPGGPVVLADIVATNEADVARDEPQWLTADIVPTGIGEVPHRTGQQLVLVLGTQQDPPPGGDGLGTYGYSMHAGGSAVLPLLEYHDDVEAVIPVSEAVVVHVPQADRLVPPGAVFDVPLHVTNRAAADATYHVDLRGVNAEWATAVPARLTVPAGATGEAVLRVAVPADARLDEAADVFVQAIRTDDDAVRGVAHVVVRVDPGAEAPARAALGAEDAEASAPSALLLAAAIALAFGRRHRR